MKHILFPVLMLLVSLTAFSQVEPILYYFDKDLKITPKSNAVFTGMGWLEDGHLKLRCFNNANKSVAFMAYFTDSTLSIFDGLFQLYYSNGDLLTDGNYVQGNQDGLWQKWDSFGNLTDSTWYQKGKKVIEATFTYHPNQNFESIVVDDRKNERLFTTYCDNSGMIVFEDTLDERAGPDSLFVIPEIEAAFPGGQAVWTTHLTKVAQKDKRALRRDRRSGTCHARFIVDKEGNVSNIKVLTMQGSALSKILVEAITGSPRWVPAMEEGRTVKSVKEIPVTYDPGFK